MDETFIMHLLNSLPQSEYEEAILIIKDKLRNGYVGLPEIEQILEDKSQAMKDAKGWDEEEDDYALFASPSKRRTPRKHLRDVVGTVESLDIKQLIVPIRKATKIRVRKPKMSIRKNRVLKETLRANDIEICQKLCSIIVGYMDILPKIARKHMTMLILLKKVCKTTKWKICWIWTVLVYVKNV